MPAKVFTQDAKVRELFREVIKGKVEATKARVVSNFEEEVPSWVSWALKPAVLAVHDMLRSRDDFVGSWAETKASAALRLVLSGECALINDVVLEVEPDEFIQVDHTVISPSGVFLIETKAWQGAFVCNHGVWKKKSGKSWFRTNSPTWQNRRHQELFRKWLAREVKQLPEGDWVRPVVLFTAASWLKVSGDEMPVFEDCLALAWRLRKWSAGQVLNERDRKRIVSAILNAKPADRSGKLAPLVPTCAVLPGPFVSRGIGSRDVRPEAVTPNRDDKSASKSEEGRTRNGRKYVRAYGTKDDADRVRREYTQRNFNTGSVRADRHKAGVWYFYLE